MISREEKLVSWLFKTNAVRVCPQDKPFWYTSGSIGPYYINTHFLYGSEKKAGNLLEVIDTEKENMLICPKKVLELVTDNYKSDSIYKGVIDSMCEYITSNINVNEIDCISGGERRDWFFSSVISSIFKKPHISIYKDLECVITEGEVVRHVKEHELEGKNILHIADLITKASSYERAWIPSIRSAGGTIRWSMVVVDRKQGGKELLHNNGIKSHAIISIDKDLFDKALSMEIIDKMQHNMLMNYIDNPYQSMRNFLKENPLFLKESMKSDEKTKKRAELCIEKNIYNL